MPRFFLIPELKGRPNDEQELAWHACKGYAWAHWQVWAAILLGLVLTGIPLFFIAKALIPYMVVPHREIKLFSVGALGGGFMTIGTRFVMDIAVAHVIRERAVEYLKELSKADPQDLDPTLGSSKSDAE